MPIAAAAQARKFLSSLAITSLMAAAALAPPCASADPAGPRLAADESGTPSAQTKPRPARSAAPRRAAQTAEAEVEDALPAIVLTPQLVYQVLASEIAAQRGQAGSAAATYLQIAQQTRDPRLARRATELSIASRSLEGALQSARLWRQLSPRSTLAAQTLEAVLLSSGQYAEAESVLTQRLERARSAGELDAFYQRLGQAMARTPDPSAALASFDRLAARDPKNAEARLAAAVLAGAAGDRARAAAESARALALRPGDPRTAVLAAGFARAAAEGPDTAIAVLEGFLKRNPNSPDARLQLARLLSEADRRDDARVQLELALRDRPEDPALLLSLAQVAAQGRQWAAAENYLTRYLGLPGDAQRDEGLARVFLAQVEEQRGRPERAIDQLARVTEGEQRLPALAKRALLLGKLGRVDEARTLLSNAEAESARERTQLLLAEGQVLREAGRRQDAFDLLAGALDADPDNPELLYDHAMAAERLGRLEAMEASFRRLIALRPDNAHAYNALGYSLADRGLRLDEAQALIARALELSPEDPHIIDSMGWVLFRKGLPAEALTWLERALRIKAEPEIAVHLGEVLWTLGRSEEARRAWAQARELDPDNETLRETLSRLRVTP